MATIGDVGDFRDAGEWIDAFASASEEALEEVTTRARVAANVLLALRACADGSARAKAETLLATCRVLMRDRRGIDCLLTTEALDQFFAAAEAANAGWSAREEAIKCVINAVYSRPEFVATLVDDGSFIPRVLALAGLKAPASWLTLVWKALLVSCECPAAVQMLAQSLDTWQLLCSTICYAVYTPKQPGNRDDDVVVEMLKLVAVIVNQINWSDNEKAASATVLETINQLGELLLFILGSDATIDVKNRVAEVFMVLPPSLTTAFVDKQREATPGNPLESILNHLETMLVAVRVEKTRPVEEMLPVLILCHNLTLAGNPRTAAAFFRAAILPPEAASTSRQGKRATFLFTHLQFFLTCLDTDVKRFAGEWLYLLCDQNAEEYTRRTGIGRAIGMLRVKGLA